MPTKSRQGEQIGVRVTIFNYMKNAIEALVLLEGSDSYKFVHIDEEGIVSISVVIFLSYFLAIDYDFGFLICIMA